MRNLLLLAFVTQLVPSALAAQSVTKPAPPIIQIPKMAAAPVFDDFVDMRPSESTTSSMARVDGFVQRWPADGQPARIQTTAYLGYTDDALHVVFLAFDPDPSALRAHLIRREEVFAVNDDAVELRLDTFGDRRQSYYFVANPLGVQLDAAWPELEGQYDESFDVVWHSRGQRTPQGFVVWMTIPFKSVRFRASETQAWGIYLGRWVPRTGEWAFWPHISNRQQSLLSQMARLDGLRNITAGRGAQVIPYATTRSFKALNASAAGGPEFVRDRVDGGVGLDAKFVLRDAVVLDLTANPDFSQVESDAPQITTNQRFEVFFPEKRPFFLENAGLLTTPINLLFTRRLRDPRVGGRLTGKVGAWTIGGLVADDEAPGLVAAPTDPSHDRSTWAGIGRVNRRLFRQSSVGALVTHRDFDGQENTVGALDAQLRLGKVWTAQGQWAASRWRPHSGEAQTAGSAYLVSLTRGGRTLTSSTRFEGASPEFVSELGFVPRVDFHQASQSVTYTARPAGTLTDWGPTLLVERVWSDDGTPLDWRARPSITFNFTRSTSFGGFIERSRVTLRPTDAPNVSGELPVDPDTWGFNASTSPRPSWSVSASFVFGKAVNFTPAGSAPPATGDQIIARITAGLRPLTPLRIDNTWLRTQLQMTTGRAFVSDILRTRWAWQFTREWSLRVIGQYESTDRDPQLTTIVPRKNLNADVLLTRLLNPWTALYVGYNGNAQNIELVGRDHGERMIRRTDRLTPDAWQVFVKWSHLLRW
jgi:hypothetical protein